MKKYLLGLWIYLLKLVGKLPSHGIRRFFYYLLKFNYPKSSIVYSGLEIRKPNDVKIGSNTVIGNGCILDGRKGIRIGCNVNFSTGVWIWTLQHDPQDPNFKAKGGIVLIEDYAWVSCRVVILPGVTIGKGAVVAAGAVVTKDVDPWTIVGGVPAKKIGMRAKVNYKLGEHAIPFI